MKKIVATIFCLFSLLSSVIAQRMTVQNYIDTYKDIAIIEMKRTGVPVAITLAQGVLETESGNSDLVKKSNNHFGIKCKAEWTGASVYHDDDENGECFRKYDSAIQSYQDHSDFLRTRAHYAFLFNLDPLDYKGWAYGLKKAGYATNPKYPEILIKTIEDYHLNDLSAQTLKDIPDYSVFQIETPRSRFSIVDKSIEKINQIIDPDKIKTKTYNGLKAVYADSGISLLAIASNYNIPLTLLLDYNDLIEDGLLNSSTWIYLERKKSEGLQDSYKVSGTESLYDIAQANAIQLSYLLAYNGLNESDTLEPGTILTLRSGAIVKSSQTNIKVKKEKGKGRFQKEKKQSEKSTAVSEKIQSHRVRPGESLAIIAKKYHVTVKEIKEINNLKSNHLKIGQKLIIPK